MPAKSLNGNSSTIPDDLKARRTTASAVVEWVASRSSSAVFLYDLAEQVSFGELTKRWSSTEEGANVVLQQTRAGAGLSLVGRLSQGSSKEGGTDAVLTAYTTPVGLSAMASAFSHIPEPLPSSRLVVQVPAVTPIGQDGELSPTTAPLTAAIGALPESFAVIFSALPQEIVDIGAAVYNSSQHHVVHVFDHHSAAREQVAITKPTLPGIHGKSVSLKESIKAAGTGFFDYYGTASPEAVLVMLNGPLSLAARAAAEKQSVWGLLVVRVLKPWDENAFLAALPGSTKEVHVVEEVVNNTAQGYLYANVAGAVFDPMAESAIVKSVRLTPDKAQELLKSPRGIVQFASGLLPGSATSMEFGSTSWKRVLFFSTPRSSLSVLPETISGAFEHQHAVQTRLLRQYDITSKPGGILLDRLLLFPSQSIADVPLTLAVPDSLPDAAQTGSDLLVITETSLIKTHETFQYARAGSAVLIASTADAEELLALIPNSSLAVIRERNLSLYSLNPLLVLESLKINLDDANSNVLQTTFIHIAFLRLYLGKASTEQLASKVVHYMLGKSVCGVDVVRLCTVVWNALHLIKVPEIAEEPLAVPDENSTPAPLRSFRFTAIVNDNIDGALDDTIGATIGSWHEAAKYLLFPNAFSPDLEPPSGAETFEQIPSLRPDAVDRTYLVTCTVNRRLTPQEYDRNVFHLEFDTSGTGLKYAIGEALGVHGWNDAEEILDFCKWYGADPEKIISLPIPEGRSGNARIRHSRSVFQALQQQVDLFGRPPKSFYSALAEHATSKIDRLALEFIGSAEGVSTFKKLGDVDTVSFADILRRYPSARPPLEVLCEMIGDIKPRHYSIASSQSVVGDQVDLLVVTVDWLTPSGSPRYGQCTRYLAGLRPGQKVTVSIKPSVMKLPPNDMQPMILAGLGTGAAPFRAFLQHRAWQSAQGIRVGPLYYYFGSRHRGQEYLYGEEIEAFILDKTITKAGLAFSRDGPKKVYIQHKMGDDANDLIRMLHDEEGVFYLCGPTWPVPDVYETLVDALVNKTGRSIVEAGDYLEGLKEEERYVLEVY